MSIEQALADLAAATSADHLGRQVVVDGVEVSCVKRELTVEEAQSFADGFGQGVEGLRLTVSRTELGYEPRYGQEITVDGKRYTVKLLKSSGDVRTITMMRFTG